MLWFIACAIVMLSITETIGDSLLKYAGADEKHYVLYIWLALGLLVYLCAALGWFFVFKHVKLGSIGMIYGLTTVISLVTIGIFVFGETYSRAEIAGIGLGFLSLILLARAL